MKTKALKGLLFSLILIFCSSIAEASLTANAVSSSQINLTWQINFNNEYGFYIARYHPSTSWQLIHFAEANTTSYADTGLSPNTGYVYAVLAFNALGYSDWSISSPVATLANGAPSTPQNLTGNAVSSSQINLTWQDNSNNEEGFYIARYHASTSWQLIDVGEANTVSYADTGLSPNTEYVYAMVAFNSAGISGWSISSPVATLSEGDTTPPSVPQNHNASANSCSQIGLSWNASTDTGGSGLKGYNLYRGGSYIKQVTAPATSSIDSGLSGETTYSYTVRAVDNADNQSGISNTAVTNTPSCQECGNSIVETPEECDDGNSIPGDGCENNCTLTPSSSGGDTLWAERLGGPKNDIGSSVTVDDNGNVIVVGTFTETADLGGGSVTAYGAQDMYVAKYSSSGFYQWAIHFGASNAFTPWAVAVDASGNVFVTGSVSGTVNLGGGSVTSTYNTPDIFVAKYSSSGAHLWSKTFGSTGTDRGYGIAVDSDGNVVVAGTFLNAVDFGGGYLMGYGVRNLFLAKYSSSGTHIWSQSVGDGPDNMPYDIALDNNDNILVTGYFESTVDFGGGPLTSEGGFDIFLAKYSSSGSHLWSRNFGNTHSDYGYSIAVDNSGNIAVTGSFNSTVDFGGGPLTSEGSSDIFLAKYSSSGSHLWSKTFGSTGTDTGYGIAVDSNGNMAVTGSFNGTVDFGNGPITGDGNADIFVAKYSPSGTHLWSEGFGGPFTDTGTCIAVNNTGETIVTGYFYGTADFGGPIFTSSWNDTFLLKISN